MSIALEWSARCATASSVPVCPILEVCSLAGTPTMLHVRSQMTHSGENGTGLHPVCIARSDDAFSSMTGCSRPSQLHLAWSISASGSAYGSHDHKLVPPFLIAWFDAMQ
jgi:hypothetical protein